MYCILGIIHKLESKVGVGGWNIALVMLEIAGKENADRGLTGELLQITWFSRGFYFCVCIIIVILLQS